MAKCKRIKATKKIICSSSLTTPIEVYSREIGCPQDNSIANTQNYEPILNAMAMVMTKRGLDLKDGVRIAEVANVEITMRYTPEITSGDWVRITDANLSQNLRILTAENVDYQSQILVLICTDEGTYNRVAAT